MILSSSYLIKKNSKIYLYIYLESTKYNNAPHFNIFSFGLLVHINKNISGTPYSLQSPLMRPDPLFVKNGILDHPKMMLPAKFG